MARQAETENLIEVGCADCMARCPYTDKTTPRLTAELGDEWYQAHLLVCRERNR